MFGPIIEYTQPLPRILAHSDYEEKLVRTRKYDFIENIDAEFKSKLSDRNVNYKSILQNICATAADCKTLVEGKPMQFDYGHLTQEGSLMLTKG